MKKEKILVNNNRKNPVYEEVDIHEKEYQKNNFGVSLYDKLKEAIEKKDIIIN
ncbi:MAG: hypothetical protein ACOC1K_03625 [Nanoarchaeota archaeon]